MGWALSAKYSSSQWITSQLIALAWFLGCLHWLYVPVTVDRHMTSSVVKHTMFSAVSRVPGLMESLSGRSLPDLAKLSLHLHDCIKGFHNAQLGLAFYTALGWHLWTPNPKMLSVLIWEEPFKTQQGLKVQMSSSQVTKWHVSEWHFPVIGHDCLPNGLCKVSIINLCCYRMVWKDRKWKNTLLLLQLIFHLSVYLLSIYSVYRSPIMGHRIQIWSVKG